MRLNLFPLKHRWLLAWLGSASSAFGAFAMLCCFGWTGLAMFLPVIGLGFLVRFSVALRLIWIALTLTALGLALSFVATAARGRWRQPRWGRGCCSIPCITRSK